MGDLLVPVNESDVVEGPDLWAESPVDAEHLVVDQRGHGHEVKDAAAVAPRVHVAILGLALV